MAIDSSSQPGREWIAYGDSMRILAVAAVVILHSLYQVPLYDKPIASGPWTFTNLLGACCRWAVPAFIMLSGAIFLQAFSRESIADFYRNRLRRIGYPLFFWTTIYFLWSHLARKVHFDIKHDLLLLLQGQPYYHLYFLFVMLGLYFVTPGLRKLMTRFSPGAFAIATWTIMFCTCGAITANRIFAFWSPNAFTLFIPFIGYYLAGFQIRDNKLKPWAMVLACAVFIIMVLATCLEYELLAKIPGMKNLHAFDVLYVYCNPATMAMSLTAFLILASLFPMLRGFENKAGNPSSPMRNVAKTTLGIYLIHPIILETSCLFYFKILHWPRVVPMEIVVVAGFTIIVSFLLTYGMMKVPWLRRVVS